MSRLRTWALVTPATAWLLAFAAVPLGLVLAASMLTRGTYGGIAPGLTVEHYRRLFDPLYLHVFGRTLGWAVLTTLACLALGYPVAWLMARSRRYRTILLWLIILPFWTSFLVRTFALIFLLRDTGVINNVLVQTGLVQAPLTLLYTPFAVLLGLVNGLLPLMVLPVYASLEKLDPTLEDAAEVLGARPAARFLTVSLPLSLPGVIAGTLLVFVSALGSYLTSDLLGGAKQVMLGNLVQSQFTTARNWPFGAAISVALLGVVLLVVRFAARWNASSGEAAA